VLEFSIYLCEHGQSGAGLSFLSCLFVTVKCWLFVSENCISLCNFNVIPVIGCIFLYQTERKLSAPYTCFSVLCAEFFIFRIDILPTGPILYGQGLPNDQQMYNYVQMLSNTNKLTLSSSSSSEALNNVTGYSAPNQPQVSSLDRINPVLPKRESSKVSQVKYLYTKGDMGTHVDNQGVHLHCLLTICFHYTYIHLIIFYKDNGNLSGITLFTVLRYRRCFRMFHKWFEFESRCLQMMTC
jgi:hypothetical protein